MALSSYHRKQKRTFSHSLPKGNKFLSCHEVSSIEELLHTYPGLKFTPTDGDSIELWKDVVKNATPKNYKKKLQYDPEVLYELMEEELHRTVGRQNILIRALKELGDSCTKVELLKLVTKMSNASSPFCLGGGSRPDTKRLILMYEVEAEVTAKKRKSYKRCAGSSASSSSSYSSSSYSGGSSSSASDNATKRAHSLAYGDGNEEDNSRIVAGMSLKHLFEDFDIREVDVSMHNLHCTSSTESENVALAPPSSDMYRDTQELFDDLMEDFEFDSWTHSQTK